MIGWVLLLFFLGTAVGSFLNVLVFRTIEGTDWVRGRSRCDHCKKTLEWFDMIPLLSYLVYRGKSRCCHHELSLTHPLIEFLMGTLFVWWYLMGSAFFQLVSEPLRTMQAGYWLFIGIVLLVVLVTDLVYGLVPTLPIYAAIALSVVYRFVILVYGPLTLVDFLTYFLSGLGTFSFFAFLHYVTKGRGMGMGDVILAPLLGLVVGWPRVLVAVVLSFWIGAAVGIVMIVLGKKKFGQSLPFAPFMIIGTVIALVWGQFLIWTAVS